MGLDIVAHRDIELIDCPTDKVNGIFEQRLYVHPHYPLHAQEIDPSAMYTIGTEIYSFRAGSYHGYSQWKTWLVELRDELHGQAMAPKDAFEELIGFDDCEGCLGAMVCTKLHHDFSTHHADISLLVTKQAWPEDERPWFMHKYLDWTRAFALGKDHGVVVFG